MSTITRDQTVTFRPGSDLLTAMLKLQARDGVPPSETIRRALREYLVKKNVLKKERSS
jgi:hypothetical protein